MIIYGKEYNFKLTVGASAKIAKLCPNEDISALGKLLERGFATSVETLAKMAHYMSEAYEVSAMFAAGVPAKDWHIEPLSEDVVLSLEADEFAQLQREVYASFAKDTEQTVEVEPEKKTDGGEPATEK